MASGIEILEIAGGNASKLSLSDAPPNLGAPGTQAGIESAQVTLFPMRIAPTLLEQARTAAIHTLSKLDLSLLVMRDQSVEDLGGIDWSQVHRPDESRFKELTRRWQDETATSSSITEMAMHPAYQQIVGMGRDALPFIFRELEQAPHHWFWALKAITREDPVSPDHRGDLEAMTRDWLQWAEEEGLLPRE